MQSISTQAGARFTVLFAVALAPLLVFGCWKAIGTTYNNPAEWLPYDFEETQHFGYFLANFKGESEMLVVSWEGCTVDDPRLPLLVAGLNDIDKPALQPRGRLFQRIWTGRSVLEDFTSEPLNLTRSQALRRMSGWLVGPDGRTSCAVLVVNLPDVEDGRIERAHRHAVIAAVEAAAEARCALKPGELYMGGPTMDAVAIDRESERSLYLLKTLSVLVAAFLCWRFLRSVRLMIVVLVTATLCESAALTVVWLSGWHMDSILMMLPALVNTLAVSGCVHYLNYYESEVEEGGVAGAAWRARARAWKPSVMASGTTAIGLISLSVADVIPVKRFGILSAVGVLISVAILFLLVPAVLELLPLERRSRRDSHAAGSTRWAARFQSVPRTLAYGSIRYHRPILTVCVILIPILTYGALQVRTSVRLQDMFSPQTEVLKNYRWLEDNIGPLVPVEVIVSFEGDNPLDVLERLRLIEDIRRSLEEMDHVGGTISAATFLPRIPSRLTVLRRATTVVQLDRHREEILAMNYLAEGEGGELWRLSARVEALADIDYGAFLEEMEARVAPIVAAENAELAGASPIEIVFTGGVPLVSTVQRRLLEDLAASFGTAFLSIAILIIIALRSFSAGLVTMLPNVFPPILIFGIMGWSGIVVDLGSMMTISTALGISVDNELHFFSWFRRFLREGLPRGKALVATYEHCGHAMEHTAIICGLGLGVFALSAFVPVARFGWLMFLLIFAAMACDLIMLPAILAGPLGSLFAGRRARPESETVAVEQTSQA